ncbi:MAG: HlyD family efflux transporter periplasmic adaptor subunit [Anaerolineae bacterium]|nr:HlyD family efflux transporter periplasmic adaptor subunit [Anaerolineae bacterium]
MRKKQVFAGFLVLATVGLLAGCGGAGATETVPADEVPLVSQEADKVVAEAIIEPARWSELRFDVSGDVAEVTVQEGDAVSAGDLLARLATGDLERAVAQAELSLRQAQVRLEQLQEPPDEADVQAAEAAVGDAQAAYQEAVKNQTVTEHSVSVGDDVRAARYARDETYRRYQALVSRLGEDDHKTAAAHDAYLDALGAYNRAVENAELQRISAQNEVTRAYHALEGAQHDLDRLLEGASEKEIEAAQLEIEAAVLSLEEARSSLEEAVLVAPFDGVVVALEVDPGDVVAAGEVVLVLAMLDQLQARTVDLTELDVARVAEGQAAVVTVDALPGVELRGRVVRIGLQSEDYRGDVTYPVTVELDEDVPELRWGMTAMVEIEAD